MVQDTPERVVVRCPEALESYRAAFLDAYGRTLRAAGYRVQDATTRLLVTRRPSPVVKSSAHG